MRPLQTNSLPRRAEQLSTPQPYGGDYQLNHRSNPNLLSPGGYGSQPGSGWTLDRQQLRLPYAGAADCSGYEPAANHYATIGPPLPASASAGRRLGSVTNFAQLLGTTTPQLRRKLSSVSQQSPGLA